MVSCRCANGKNVRENENGPSFGIIFEDSDRSQRGGTMAPDTKYAEYLEHEVGNQ